MIEQVCLNELLLESAKEIFETMVFMDLAECTEPAENAEDCALLGTITFKGALEGCLAFCCSVPCARAIAMNMLGIDTSEEIAEEDVCDAIGEICNMVMGSVKKRLAESAGNLEVSIPSVVSGRQLKNNMGEGSHKTTVKINIEDEYVTELSLLYHENSN
ncbi:MAG: hypothetical protein DRP66_02420 [Planctomycetota bacterium]|nr:MAG: hypothetical protein DRP66_02420 [Planctomycetota bacterium]